MLTHNYSYYINKMKKKKGLVSKIESIITHKQCNFLIAQFQILQYFNLWAAAVTVDDDLERDGI